MARDKNINQKMGCSKSNLAKPMGAQNNGKIKEDI